MRAVLMVSFTLMTIAACSGASAPTRANANKAGAPMIWETVPVAGVGDLNSVACTSATNCWAVGATPTGLVQRSGSLLSSTMSMAIIHFDGTSWVPIAPPSDDQFAEVVDRVLEKV